MYKYSILLISGICLLLFSCKKDAKSFNGKTVDYIKKEIVHTKDGLELDLGGDSISKVFYLIRHAEKDTQKMDPPLNAEGYKRAAKLTSIMRQTYLDAVYTTLTSRTISTVDSITQYKGLSNSIYTATNIKETFQSMLKNPEIRKALIVGHTNTVTPIANFLYGKQYFNKIIDEKEFDNLYIIVEKRDSSKQIYELKY